MKIRERLFAIWNVVVLSSSILAFGVTKAWFLNGNEFGNNTLEASSVSNYFAGGDGSELNPYRLTNPTHVYNLSWLQQKGVFRDTTTYFKAADASGNPVEIDFAGYLNGGTGTTGAIPPIGTDENPFTGVFDGNGSTFKNVWVSTRPSDWKEKPADANMTYTNPYVGFFGSIDVKNGQTGKVENFYLENIEITCTVPDAVVGLAIGYLNADAERIGVKNGKISMTTGVQYESMSTLVGEISEYVSWEDIPTDDPGGNILINPTYDLNGSINQKTSIIDSYDEKEDKYYAYYMSSWTRTAPTPQPQTGKRAPGTASFDDTSDFDIFQAYTDNAVAPTRRNTENEFYDLLFNRTGSIYTIAPGGAPNWNVNSLEDYPGNTIWFQPRHTGVCALAFTRTNNSADWESMSVYRYKRASNGKIDSSTRQEIRFDMQKGLGNGVPVYFDLSITDITYEYCIGQPSRLDGKKGGTAAFVFLKLGGARNSGAPGDPLYFLKKIDYVYKYNEQWLKDLSVEEYEPNHLLLKLEGTTTSNSYLCVNMNDIENSSIVYYSFSGMDVEDQVKVQSVGSQVTYSEQQFPPRLEARSSP